MHPIMHRTDEHLETASCMAQLYYTIFYLAFLFLGQFCVLLQCSTTVKKSFCLLTVTQRRVTLIGVA